MDICRPSTANWAGRSAAACSTLALSTTYLVCTYVGMPCFDLEDCQAMTRQCFARCVTSGRKRENLFFLLAGFSPQLALRRLTLRMSARHLLVVSVIREQYCCDIRAYKGEPQLFGPSVNRRVVCRRRRMPVQATSRYRRPTKSPQHRG